MYHSGIGGGGFALIRSPDGVFEHVDFRETAPAAAFQDMYAGNKQASVVGGLARYASPKRKYLESIFAPADTIAVVCQAKC